MHQSNVLIPNSEKCHRTTFNLVRQGTRYIKSRKSARDFSQGRYLLALLNLLGSQVDICFSRIGNTYYFSLLFYLLPGCILNYIFTCLISHQALNHLRCRSLLLLCHQYGTLLRLMHTYNSNLYQAARNQENRQPSTKTKTKINK